MSPEPRIRLGLGAFLVSALCLGLLETGFGQDQVPPKKLNPYTGKDDAIQAGRALYLQYGCSGCHGVMGGGGMALPLLDDVWKFGSDDQTLFKLIKGQIDEQMMPKVWGTVPDDEVWKIIAYVRSLYQGDPSKINW